MNQKERREYLIDYLKNEEKRWIGIDVPADEPSQKRLLRSLMNIRAPKEVSEEFLTVQDAYLQEESKQKGVIHLSELNPVCPGIYLWQGDITRLSVDGIVNAANNALLGCFIPCHGCIDNAIHSSAGVQLRLECSHVMEEQGTPEPTGRAKITEAYNLPCRHVLHTVGPVISGSVTPRDRELLTGCYHSCLELAAANHLKSIAFCCISTGEFRFPNEEAAEIAVRTVKEFLAENSCGLEVIFNVFKDADYKIYSRKLG